MENDAIDQLTGMGIGERFNWATRYYKRKVAGTSARFARKKGKETEVRTRRRCGHCLFFWNCWREVEVRQSARCWLFVEGTLRWRLLLRRATACCCSNPVAPRPRGHQG